MTASGNIPCTSRGVLPCLILLRRLHVHNAAQARCKALTLLARLWMAAAAFTPASQPAAWASFLTALHALNTSQP